MEETTKLRDKKIDDLTVGDSVKIQLAALAIMAGGAVAIGAAVTAADKISLKLKARKAQKSNTPDELTDET